MTAFIDLGVRCDAHTGEVFPPRCPVCASLTGEWEAMRPTVCYRHPMHFVPCEKCAGDG